MHKDGEMVPVTCGRMCYYCCLPCHSSIQCSEYFATKVSNKLNEAASACDNNF